MKKYKSVKKKREQMRKIQIIAVIVVALIFIISVIILLIRKFDLTEDSDSSNLLVEPVNAGKMNLLQKNQA